MPTAEGILGLLRDTVVAVDQANRTGNYTVLRDLTSPASQAINSADNLARSFQSIRMQRIDLSVASTASPELSQVPLVTPQGYLRLTGWFDTRPRITFDVFYEWVSYKWRPYAIGLGLVPVPVLPPSAGAHPSAPPSRQGSEAPPNAGAASAPSRAFPSAPTGTGRASAASAKPPARSATSPKRTASPSRTRSEAPKPKPPASSPDEETTTE
jgi:hypothetical protein